MLKQKGELILISGPMYAGKSKQLILLYKYFEKKAVKQIAFRPSFDTRTITIESRHGGSIASLSIHSKEDFVKYVKEYDVIFIDEFHFFNKEIIEEIFKWQKKKNFIISGLDKDFLKENFEQYDILKNKATLEIKMTAICHSCQRVAKYSRKKEELVGKKENNFERIQLDRGGKNTQYFSSCEQCHPVK